jgi:serine/threonine protein kinase
MIVRERKVGKYLIQRLIAQGGMGKIYKAKHPTLKQDCYS